MNYSRTPVENCKCLSNGKGMEFRFSARACRVQVFMETNLITSTIYKSTMEVSCLDYLFELDEELFSTCAQLITSISYRMCNYFFGNRYMFQGNIAAHVL